MARNMVKIDTSLIPRVETELLCRSLIRLFETWAEDPEIMREFEEWKKQREHKNNITIKEA